jgi:glycyl-tRNA synthetase
MNFQEVIMKLNQFWAGHGCIVWQPHNVQIGAGTANPATILRVLGPEPWNVAYLEPSVRPADGRYGENPNRWQEYYQYQVILKPETGNHIALYLESLEALGIDWQRHDVRFVEDNWQSPSLGAWGLGWEVWLDGLEITQYTYFQQACGVDLDPVCVEITYGLERIVMFLQGVGSIPEIDWLGDIRYGDVHLADEVDYCRYNFDIADVERLRQMYDLNEAEARQALAHSLVLPAHDYVLKCSHLFNVLDARRAVGVAQRAQYFVRMRDLARQVAQAYLRQREQLQYPLAQRQTTQIPVVRPQRRHPVTQIALDMPADFVLEIGTEELPAADLTAALKQLGNLTPLLLAKYRLLYSSVEVGGTPRRLVVYVRRLATRQMDEQHLFYGPAESIAFDASGKPTAAALGFARAHNVSPDALKIETIKGRRVVAVHKVDVGRSAAQVMQHAVPELIAALHFTLSMRWNETEVTFARPIRWLLTLHGHELVAVEYAGVFSDRYTYGLRSHGTPEILVLEAEGYHACVCEANILIDAEARRSEVWHQVTALAEGVGGVIESDDDLLTEVANLAEQPMGILGYFDEEFLSVPELVLIAVMRKHQRYFPVRNPDSGQLMPCFITIANGKGIDVDLVRRGNEAVLRARFSDAVFFHRADTAQSLAEFVPQLASLVFQQDVGSYLEKTQRICQLIPFLAAQAGVSAETLATAERAAVLCKADLVTRMVAEFTSLQGVMGRIYAERSGESELVARAIYEHYLPRFLEDELPQSLAGALVGIADRLDTLVSLFAVGMAPTGTADPFGLRRAALGIVQILVDRKISISVLEATRQAAQLIPQAKNETLKEVAQFVRRRLQGWLTEQTFRPDLVEAVLAERGDNPAAAYATVREMSEWANRPEFVAVVNTYMRVTRLASTSGRTLPLDPAWLNDPTAQRLYTAYQAVHKQVDQDMPVGMLLEAMQTLTEPVQAFFENVLVMHEDETLRVARLGLLQRLAELPHGVVDLTRVSNV